ncbi:helix-turn-helix domain-containing protein [Nonomuraea sp. NEAU-A123]|uniref:helix-turn-helix domain-containing protein n=1 Tax=Nonomuraea sp. NEAU-A123 TaxID=2839649 RepID=UPI001BE41D18|nr:helix-turn-helix domain-containing protein [Nonomuraea sp. NEAU-A123]MBT2226651.1 helix-turn-helix domain-containing protein [Nonomuraea sp. NEAU-A123]
MSDGAHQRRLGELLTELKDRSGYSYAAIGRKANVSKSAVHRYCVGLSVPQTFGAIESIARACGADWATMNRLYAEWAVASEAAEPAPPKEEEEPAPPKEVEETPPPEAPAERPGPIRRHARALAATAVVFSIVLTATVIVLRSPAQPAPAQSGGPGIEQQISGPAWALPPEPVPRTLFGATLNSSSGAMPDFDLGAVRFWDSETRWSQVEPQRGVFDWRTLDSLVAGAQRAGLPALYVAGGTPAWAAPDGAHSVYPEGARSAPPDDLAEWDRFIRALAHRYRGRINAYELWVLASDKRMYTGTPETLVVMTRRASAIIRSIDPKATIVCPGMGNLWTAEGRQILQRFAELGGYDHCDVAGIKLYQQAATDPPETMLDLLGAVDRLFHEAGVHPRLWNTGTTYTIALQQPLDQAMARNYAVRFFLVGMYARNYHLERMYFYNWGGTKIPIVLQAEGGKPTAAARAVETLQSWLASAQSRSCGHGLSAGLPSNAWQCEFTIGSGAAAHPAAVQWTQSGAAAIRANAAVISVRHLDGRVDHPSPGETLHITGEPILIEYA